MVVWFNGLVGNALVVCVGGLRWGRCQGGLVHRSGLLRRWCKGVAVVDIASSTTKEREEVKGGERRG